MGQYFDNQDLPSKMVKTECSLLGNRFIFYTDNGVFSKDGLDFGDMGCGYGVLGIVLNKLTSCTVDMVDVNLRAIHLSEINIRENHSQNISVFESNVYENIHSKYSCIVTNPPIRAGKKVVYDIVMNAKDYLEEDGALFLVIRKEQGAKSLIIDLRKQYNVEVLEKKKGFFILKCTVLKNVG